MSSSIEEGDTDARGDPSEGEKAANHARTVSVQPKDTAAENGEPNATNDGGGTADPEKSSTRTEYKKDNALPAAYTESETTATPRDSDDALMKGAAKNGSSMGIDGSLGAEIEDIHNYRFLERYFYKIHAPLIYRFRIPIVILFAVLFVRFDVNVVVCQTFLSPSVVYVSSLRIFSAP